MFKIVLLLAWLSSACQAQNATTTSPAGTTRSKIDYTNPDLNTTANYVTGPVFLEAYKSRENDRILKEADSSKYGQLEWYSLGAPKIFKTLCVIANKSFLFHLGNRGFHTFVNALQFGQRRALAHEASTRLSVPVQMTQIKPVPVSRIDCFLYFNETGSGRTYLIKGSGTNFEAVAYRINFRAPSDSYERHVFERRDNKSQPFKLECQYWAGQLSEKSTPLVINPAQFKTIDIIKKALGTAPSVLMTRQQLLNLADLVYRSLKIMQNFQAAEYEFAEEFIKLVTKKEKFTQVPFDKALKSMSRYSLDPKLNLSVANLNKMISNTFKVEKAAGDVPVIKVIGKMDKSLAIILGLTSAKTIRDYHDDWVASKRELDAQVYDVNYWSSNEVEWKLENGAQLVPKSIALVKVNKPVFQNAFKFQTVNKTLVKAEFTKLVRLDANI